MKRANDAILLTDENWWIVEADDRALETYGYTLAELQQKQMVDLRAPEHRISFPQVAERLSAEGRVLLKTVHQRKDGTIFPVEVSVQSAKIGGATYTLSIVRDLTEYKRREKALRDAVNEWQRTFDSVSDVVWLLDENQHIVRANAATETILHEVASAVIGKRCWEVVHGTSGPIPECPCVRMRKSLKRERIELQRNQQWFVVTVDPILDEAGGLTEAVHIVRDTTERKRAEAEQAALLEIAKDIAGVTDLKDLLNRVHQRTANLLPCDRVATYCWDAAHGAYRALGWYGVQSHLEPDIIKVEFHSDQPLAKRLLAGETVVMNDIVNQRLVPLEILTHFGLTAVLIAPFVAHGRGMGAVGALNAESGRHFEPHQARLLEGIAQQVGVAIQAAELARAQEEDAAVAGALAHVGQQLIASLSSHALLNHLCQLTAEVLGCDRSGTWLWDAREEAFVPVASSGDSPEQWEITRLVKLGRWELAMQLEGMERGGIFKTKVAQLPASRAKMLAHSQGMTVGLMVPLRRGGELVGFHTADYCGRDEALGERHERIARGISQLASLALENVRLFEELERANHLKSDFVATMSHELRTPLNIFMGYNELLLDGSFGPVTEEQVDTLQRMEKSAQGLLELITATLDLSRLDSGQVRPAVKAIALPDLVSELDAEFSGLQGKPNVDFRWDVVPELPELYSDPVKLKLVFKNLIGNAIKFTDAGAVVVRLRARDGGVEITVTDTGAGIAREMLPVIFEPFRQGEPAGTHQHGGVGLGLYIVRRLLYILGGTIDVESTVGQGSTFRVWVPNITLGNTTLAAVSNAPNGGGG
jgi:PAS domain S-box-containing protein